LPIIYVAVATFASSPQGQQAIIAGSRLLSRYGAQLQSFLWTGRGLVISSEIFRRVGPALTGRLAETLRGAPETFRNTRGIDNFVNGTAISIKTLDITAKTYQSVSNLSSRLTGYVQQLASYAGGDTPIGFLPAARIQHRVLEIILPTANLSRQQMEVLVRVQAEAARRGVSVIYFRTQ